MFDEIYKKLLDNYCKAETELENYGSLIKQCSTFNTESIGNVLSRIATSIEGREFVFKKKVWINDVKDDYSPYQKLNLLLEKDIVDRKFSTETYGSFRRSGRAWTKDGHLVPHVEFLSDESRNIFKLNELRKLTWFKDFQDYNHTSNSSFYNFAPHSLSYHPLRSYMNMNFKEFGYLSTFINDVIDYRIQNQLMEISDQELNCLADKFLNEYSKDNNKNKEFIKKL